MEDEAGGSCRPDPDQPGGGEEEEDGRDSRARGQGSRNDGPRGQSSSKDDGRQDQSSSKDGPREDRDDEDIDSRRFVVSSGLTSPLSLFRDYLQTNSSVMPRELVDQGESEDESYVF